MIARHANMLERVSANLADVIHKELNGVCPEESMSNNLFDIDGQIVDASFEGGQIIVKIKKQSSLFNLRLKPISWEKDK